MTKQRHISALVIGASLTAACLVGAGSVTASDEGSWPASKASEPTPKVPGMTAELAKHLANFDDLDGESTAVMGFLDGTFTKPMVLPNGAVIQPTGKSYHLPMATLGRWNTEGTMSEEYLFWDNATLMQQIGVGN